MKVGMLVWNYWPGPEGGAERQCRKVTHQLGKDGVESVVLTSLSSYRLNRISNDGAVIIHRFGILCPFSESFRALLYRLTGVVGANSEVFVRALIFWLILPLEWLARLSFILEIRFILSSNKYDLDVLHVHETAWLAGVGSWFGKRWGLPVLCKVRNTPALDVIGYDTPFRSVWKRLREDVAFIALHQELKQELISSGIESEKVVIIPNGVEIPDISSREPLSLEVLYVGNFSQGSSHKGFDTLIRGWSEVVREIPEAHLTLVGGGDFTLWKKFADDLGCGDTVTFTGAVKNPAQFYSWATVFVLPSRYEGMSNSLLEAQSWGLTCIVSDIAANLAVVSDGNNGLVFRVDDSSQMARKIVKVLSDTQICLEIGQNARKKAEDVYNLERVTEKLKLAYSTAQ